MQNINGQYCSRMQLTFINHVMFVNEQEDLLDIQFGKIGDYIMEETFLKWGFECIGPIKYYA